MNQEQNNALERIKKEASGYPEIWAGLTKAQLIEKTKDEIEKRWREHDITIEEIKLACSFLVIALERGELKGSVSNEVSKAISNAMTYYTNCVGKEGAPC